MMPSLVSVEKKKISLKYLANINMNTWGYVGLVSFPVTSAAGASTLCMEVVCSRCSLRVS